MFGKMLKYKGIGCVILECGASGLTVGGGITQETKKVWEEGRENITTLTNHNSCAGPISHYYYIKILIYLHNICLSSRFENVQYINKTNCKSNICLFGDERGDGSKRATASLSSTQQAARKWRAIRAGRTCCHKLGALPAGGGGGADMLAAVFHHCLVFNPPKSVSLWPHTCASSYQGLWWSNSLSASVALLQSRRALSVFISIPILPCSDLETTNKTYKNEKTVFCSSYACYFCWPLVCASLVTMACLDEYMRAYRGEYKGVFSVLDHCSSWKKRKYSWVQMQFHHISTEPVCPLTQSQGEQDQVLSLLRNTKQVVINPVSCKIKQKLAPK